MRCGAVQPTAFWLTLRHLLTRVSFSSDNTCVLLPSVKMEENLIVLLCICTGSMLVDVQSARGFRRGCVGDDNLTMTLCIADILLTAQEIELTHYLPFPFKPDHLALAWAPYLWLQNVFILLSSCIYSFFFSPLSFFCGVCVTPRPGLTALISAGQKLGYVMATCDNRLWRMGDESSVSGQVLNRWTVAASGLWGWEQCERGGADTFNAIETTEEERGICSPVDPCPAIALNLDGTHH